MRTRSHGWTCTKCRRHVKVVRVVNESQADELFLCADCLTRIITEIPEPKRSKIRRAVVAQRRK